MHKYVVIYNPVSGEERGEEWKDLLKSKLEQAAEADSVSAEITVRETQREGDGARLAYEAAEEGADSIFAIGGDGLVTEVIEGILNSTADPKPVLGAVPGGTFNAFTKTLRFPQDPAAMIEALDLERTETVDIGVCNEHKFNYIFSVGSVPTAAMEVEDERKAKFGIAAYLGDMLKAGVKSEAKPYTLTLADGTVIEENYTHIVVILSNQLGTWRIADVPMGKADGRLHVLCLKDLKFTELLSLTASFLAGDVTEHEAMDYYRVSSLKIASSEAQISMVDGDEGDALPVQLSVLPSALRVYTADPASED